MPLWRQIHDPPWCDYACVGCMAGVDAVRGIAYQQAHAVLAALDVLDDTNLAAIRVEGVHDVVDIELFTLVMSVHHAKQVKTRIEPYTWGEAELLAVLRRWASLPGADHATFELLTNGRLGPSGEKVQAALRSVRDFARKEWPLRGSTTSRSAIADRCHPSGGHHPLAAPFGRRWGRGICDGRRLDPLAVFVLAAAPGVGTL